MVRPLVNIAIAGASGNVGKPLTHELLNAGTFKVTALSREGSTSSFPDGVKVTRVDYESLDSLTAALKGQDALILTQGAYDMEQFERTSKLFIDAAISAGVRRIFPSDFGVDTTLPAAQKHAALAAKRNIRAYFLQKVAEGKVEQTTIFSGPFFDWGLDVEFLGFNIKERKVTLYDKGTYKFSTTTLTTIAKVIVAALQNPDASANKNLHTSDAYVTQLEILEVLEAELGPFEKTPVAVSDLVAKANEDAAKGQITATTFISWIIATIWTEESTSRWERNDHSVVGLQEWVVDWKDVVKGKAAQFK